MTHPRLLDPIVVEKLGGVPLSLERAEEYGSSHHLYAFFGVDGSQDAGAARRHDAQRRRSLFPSLPPRMHGRPLAAL